MIYFSIKLTAGIVHDINDNFRKCIMREVYQKHSYNTRARYAIMMFSRESKISYSL